MPTFSSESRASIAPLLFTLDRLSAHSYNESAARTSNTRADHYLKFCAEVNVKDPYLTNVSPSDANQFFAAYAVYLAIGNTIKHITIKSGTITSYLADAANAVQNGRKAHSNIPSPDPRIDIATGKTHHDITKVKKEVERWENMPDRRNPMTKGMLSRLASMINPLLLFSLAFVLLDWFILGLHLGFRLSEYAQKKNVTQLAKVKKNLDGRPRAFLSEDFEFFGDGQVHISHDDAIANPRSVVTVDLCWRQQKNKQNGEKKSVHQNKRIPSLCGVRAAIRIIDRARQLKLDKNHPVCVYTSTGKADGPIKFVTETHISDSLKNLAKLEYNITDPDELDKYTSHSVRVGACVALHAAGRDKLEIQFSLRWRSTTFWNYLRNLPTQAYRCMAAIRDFNPMSVSF